MKEWLKKYSIQVSILAIVVASILSVITTAGVEIPQPILVGLLLINGVLSGVARVIPQTK